MVVGEEKLDTDVDADKFLAVVNAVNRSLTEDAIVAMNAAVTDGQDDADVATGFLRDAGMMKPLGADD